MWVLMWFRRSVTVRKAFRHRWQVWGLSLLCVFTWRFKLEIRGVVNRQKLQWKVCVTPAGRR